MAGACGRAAVVMRAAVLPVADLGDQELPEVLPVDAARLAQGQRDAECPALPGCGEGELAVVPGRGRGAGRVKEIRGIRMAAGVGHGALTAATPTMASLVTRAASSSSDRCPVPSGRSGITM